MHWDLPPFTGNAADLCLWASFKNCIACGVVYNAARRARPMKLYKIIFFYWSQSLIFLTPFTYSMEGPSDKLESLIGFGVASVIIWRQNLSNSLEKWYPRASDSIEGITANEDLKRTEAARNHHHTLLWSGEGGTGSNKRVLEMHPSQRTVWNYLWNYGRSICKCSSGCGINYRQCRQYR